MMEVEDGALVAQTRAGDEEAFRALVERHSHALFRLAYRMTGNEQDAEDTVQETFLRAHRKLDRFEPRASFAAWLHRIAANYALDLLRRRKRRAATYEPLEQLEAEMVEAKPADVPAPDHAACHAEVKRRVESAMDQLTPMERTAFVFRHFENRTIREIGATLEIGESATKQAIFRAVHKLRRVLEPFYQQVK